MYILSNEINETQLPVYMYISNDLKWTLDEKVVGIHVLLHVEFDGNSKEFHRLSYTGLLLLGMLIVFS